MHRGLDENQAFDAVFDGRERSVNLIRRLMAHSSRKGPGKIRVKVGKGFNIAFRMTYLYTSDPPGVFTDQRIRSPGDDFLETVKFPVGQSIRVFLMPFETASLAKDTKI